MKDKVNDVICQKSFAASFGNGLWLVNTKYGISVLTNMDPYDENGQVRSDFPCCDSIEKRRLIRKVNPDMVISVEKIPETVFAYPGGERKEGGYTEITGTLNGTARCSRTSLRGAGSILARTDIRLRPSARSKAASTGTSGFSRRISSGSAATTLSA